MDLPCHVTDSHSSGHGRQAGNVTMSGYYYSVFFVIFDPKYISYHSLANFDINFFLNLKLKYEILMVFGKIFIIGTK